MTRGRLLAAAAASPQITVMLGPSAPERCSPALLDGIEGVHITRFNDKDVVRHALVGRIVRAYDAAGAKQAADKA